MPFFRSHEEDLPFAGQAQRIFVSIEAANLELKRKKAQSLVRRYVATSAIGAAPLPGPDAVLLVPEQIAILSQVAQGKMSFDSLRGRSGRKKLQKLFLENDHRVVGKKPPSGRRLHKK